LAAARLPNLDRLLEGRRLVLAEAPFEGSRASLRALDANLGVGGDPQSATGQAALLTGRNVPAEVGEHYGPKPDPRVAAALRRGNLFQEVQSRGGSCALLNAYPPRYFEGIQSRRRLYSAIPLAATLAGLELNTAEDLRAGRALSADFTGAGWASQRGFPSAPIYTDDEAGRLLARLSLGYHLAWFDYWLSDYAGHHGEMDKAVQLLESLDAVLGGLIDAWVDRTDLVVITSDHGNLEDLSVRGHTQNPVPLLLVGPADLRSAFAPGGSDLTCVAPAVLATIFDRGTL
jgi:hypothetical protein